MKAYFDHMNTYHLSYAAFTNDGKSQTSYLRARRYMPGKSGLRGTALQPEYESTTMFAPDVKHHITLIKSGRSIHMKVENAGEVAFFPFHNDRLPDLSQGRIGLRHMSTRSATYAGFTVSTRIR